MEKELEEQLKVLNSEVCINKPEAALVVIDKIGQHFHCEQSQFTINLLIGLILEENDGLFSFVWKTCSKSETVNSAAAALKLVESLITDFKELTQPYFCNVYEKCLSLVDTHFAKVKEISLKIVKYLLIEDSKLCLNLSKLTSKLDKYLGEDLKIPGTVAEQLYCILGVLFEKYPESIEKDHKCFFNKLNYTLKRELTVLKNPSVSKIRGAFEGLNGYLINYPPPENDVILQIYGFIKELAKFGKGTRTASRSAFKLLQNHWKVFSELVFHDRGFWKENLTYWIKLNLEDRQCGFLTLTSFYRMIILEVKKNSNDLDIVDSYLSDFIRILKSKESNSFEKRSALVGIKLFVLANCVENQKLNETYQILIDLIQKQGFGFVSYLPLCIECVSVFVLKCCASNQERLMYLQKMSVTLISEYPKVKTNFQSYALTALEKSFYTLSLSKLESLDSHVGRVLYQGLIRSCSCITIVDEEVLKESQETKENLITYKSYLGLWKYLLNLASTSVLPINNSFITKKTVSVKVIDAYISGFLKILSKLNLNIKAENTDLENKKEEPEVENPNDIRIFVNCVDLYVDLLPFISHDYLQKWLNKIFLEVIYQSYKNPLVAGFYKIISATFKVADFLNFFEGSTKGNKTSKCCESVRAFLEEVLMKADQFKSDLQVACLEAFLAAPVSLIEPFAEKTIPVLEAIIRLGRGNFPLLKNLIETLERWNYYLPTNTVHTIMKRILPYFDIFFQSLYFQGDLGCINREGKKLQKIVFNDSELLTLQRRFLLFLGNMDINTAMHLIELKDCAEEEKKIDDKRVVYYPPFSEATCEVNLDDLLSRICELATSCSDRRTRIIACELLYSVFMIILNNINQLNGGFTVAFRKAVRSCVILGCDSDSLVFQIFEPLMFQITHYFSMKKAIHFSETQDLLDILVEFVTCPYDPTARDFAALLIREYTIWCIKQLTPEELKVTPDNIKRILNNIYSLSLHPSYNKRLGSAVIFNKIYSVLREEDFILSAYWFMLFYHFMECLKMCDELEDVTEILEAIEHIKRPLIEKHIYFNESSAIRIVPPEFSGGELSHLVKWTFMSCHDTRAHTRRTAMSLVEELAPLVKGSQSLSDFIRIYLDEKPFHIRQTFLESQNSIQIFKFCGAVFEYYTWLLKLNLITANEALEFKFNDTTKKFVTEISLHQENNFHFAFIKRQNVLSFLTYLLVLKEKAYYFRPHIWEMLKISIFKPSEYGFDLNDAINMEKLSSLLIKLLEFFSIKLTQYEWDQFFENVESLITSPVLKQITRSGQLNTNHLEFLYAVKIFENSGLWKLFAERTLYALDNGVIVGSIFNSLFFKQGNNVCALSLEPPCKVYLEKLLEFGLKVNSLAEKVFYYLENTEVVYQEETEKLVQRGRYFLFQFKNVIHDFLHSNAEVFIDRILADLQDERLYFLTTILESQKVDGMRKELPQEVFRRWLNFLKMDPTNKNFRRRKWSLLHLGARAAEVVGTPGFLKNTPFFRWLYSSLENESFVNIDIEEVEKIFKLMPFFSSFGEIEGDNEILNNFLQKVFLDQDVFSYTEEPESSQKKCLEIALKGLLCSLKISGSLVILRFFLKNAKFLKSFLLQNELESVISVFANPEMPCSQPMSALSLVYSSLFEMRNFQTISFVYKYFLNPLMEKLPGVVVYDFVVRNLENLCTLILSPLDLNVPKIAKIELQKKTCASGILKLLFFKLSKEELELMPKDKRQLIDKLVKSSIDLVIKDKINILAETYRLFMCELFNMICSIICTKSLNHKVYKLFIFDVRGSFLYHVIPQDMVCALDMDFDDIPKRKKYLTFLRRTISHENQLSVEQTLHSVKYIQTNTLFSSSLVEDVTKFDLTHSPIRPISSIEGKALPQVSTNMEIELEGDIFNNHECMATLIGVVQKMVKEKITPFPVEGEALGLPCWLDFFVSVLKNENRHENLKLFILKAVYNLQEYVKPYCEEVFSVVLDSVCTLFSQRPINYFLMDLIVMMVEWRYLPQNEKSQIQLTQLVTTVISKSDSFRRDIVKNNLEILKTMIEVWKNVIVKDTLSVFCFQRLSVSLGENVEVNFNTLDGVTYIDGHICGILLSNGISPWKKGCARMFFTFILRGFHEENKNKEHFAEICGLALKHIQETGMGNLNEFENLVEQKIQRQSNTGLLLLYGIHKNYPKIISKFVFKIFTNAWTFVNSLTVKYLEMLLSVASGKISMNNDVFDLNSATFLVDMLNSSDIAVHEITLQIAANLCDKMDEGRLNIIVPEIIKMHRSTSMGIRKWVYEIAKKYYSKAEYSSNIRYQCKIVLLRGLNDGVKELEELCLEFLQKEFNFSSPYSKLIFILREMYSPEAETEFLNIMTKLLLDSAVPMERYQQPICSNPITRDCRFQKRNIILGIRKTSLPSFLSGRMWTNHSLECMASLKSQHIPYVRPTSSSLKFDPTNREKVSESDIAGTSLNVVEPEETLTNPSRRRFFKSVEKTNASFMRYQIRKKKKEVKEKEDLLEKKKNSVILLGNYSSGDYPDIQISHFQVLKPLQLLARKDHQIARQFLVSFYVGLYNSLNTKQKEDLLMETHKCFDFIFKSSQTFDPGVFGFVFQILLKYPKKLNIDCEQISRAAISSNWLSLGALVIEEIINNVDDREEELTKRRKGIQTSRDKRWLELARLYRNLKESDVTFGIFLNKLEVDGFAEKAVRFETLQDWARASECYETLLMEDCASNESEFYMDSYFLCLAKLSDWSRLNACIKISVDNDLKKMWKNHNFLSWYLKSEVMVSLSLNKRAFETIIENFCQKKSNAEYLSRNYTEQTAVFDLLSRRLQTATHKINRLCLDFLSDWSHLTQWSYNLRATKLANLQTLSELNYVVRTLSDKRTSQLEENIAEGIKRWDRNFATAADDLVIWDVKLNYRKELLKEIRDLQLVKAFFKSSLALVKAALEQENLSLAKEHLSKVKENLSKIGEDFKSEYEYYFTLGKIILGRRKMNEEKSGLEFFCQTWKTILYKISEAATKQSEMSRISTFRCYSAMGNLVSLILPSITNDTSPDIINALRSLLELPEDEPVREILTKKGMEYLESANSLFESSTSFRSEQANSYLELSKYILKYVKVTTFADFEKLVKNLLTAMSLGSKEARDLFGCILNKCPVVAEEEMLTGIITTCDAVPTWMFLKWINQILASLSSNLFFFLKYIVFRIMEDYPNAIRYAFRLSKEKVRSDDSRLASLFRKLEGMLSNKIYENFLRSMNYLGPPDLILKYHLEVILQKINEGNPNHTSIMMDIINLHELMYSRNFENFRGPAFQFCNQFKSAIEALMGLENDKEIWKKHVSEIIKAIGTSKLPSKRTLGLLESYSPWLAKFHFLKEGCLEIPGQYECIQKPLTKYMVMISSFKNDVIMFHSKCKPLRISILGNDAAEHKFLIKFSEDLSQDQRIQQVFTHFNSRLKENKQTRRFVLEVFKVIPISTVLGMIEWVDNNVSLHEMIDFIIRHEGDSIEKAQAEHLAHLAQDKHVSGPVAAHLVAYEKMSRETAVSLYNQRVHKFPQDLLKTCFWTMSTSPEHFFYLRSNFAISHAVLCITHWLVGIGDRHLQNSLVSTKTGRVLGIDFGYAFGFATEFLTPPELVPFRLTPQILNLMRPLKESGWIKQTMIHCLRLFRKEHFVLLSILEVFAHEPVIDWLFQAKKSQLCNSDCLGNWYPRQKISMVERKLNGANPVAIFEMDLKVGHSQSKFLEKYLEVLKGMESHNIRARCPETGLTEEQQVDCLIDLATDEHVLSKTYVGWNPWL